MNIKQIAYHGWDNCIELTNDAIRLIVTADVGPRILFCGFMDGDNLFYENMEQAGSTGGDSWKTYGGHRLWCSPEVLKTTYAPDNFPVDMAFSTRSASFIAPVERTGVQKTIEVSFPDGKDQVYIDHRITNQGDTEITLAPWALTVMRQGGMAIVPHNLEHIQQFLPTHCIALWGYTNLSDPRWTWGDSYIFLRQDPQAPAPQKIGTVNKEGWAAYSVANQLFVKRFPFQPEATYPDYQCNFETYTNDQILELETLGPLQTLAPGETALHQEEWFLYRDVPPIIDEQAVESVILPLLFG